jgi:acyl-CoA synthetase (AMP-forming)/AMP-acid ligase II
MRDVFPSEETIPSRLESVAAARPTATAVRFLESRGGTPAPAVTEWTYIELTGRTHRLAAALRAAGAEPGERALLLVPSDLDMVQALLGCLYAGVIAVPVPLP